MIRYTAPRQAYQHLPFLSFPLKHLRLQLTITKQELPCPKVIPICRFSAVNTPVYCDYTCMPYRLFFFFGFGFRALLIKKNQIPSSLPGILLITFQYLRNSGGSESGGMASLCHWSGHHARYDHF